jgi:PAS domain S-box-containing protein
MNVEIKNFFLLMVSAITILLWTLFFMVDKQQTSSYELDRLVMERHEMIMYSKVLRQSSDDLSKYARLYAITLDEKYKEIYRNVLGVRNGEDSRPLNYDLIYWDLLEPQRSLRHPLGEKKALKEIIKELPFDEFEYGKLEQAQKNSDELAALERAAMSEASGEKGRGEAINFLHSHEYLREKAKIMLPLDEFLTHLEARTISQINSLKQAMENNMDNLIYVVVAFVIVTILFFILMYVKILNPISDLSEEIHKFKNSSDSTEDDKTFYDDEIGDLSKEFYKMRDKIKKDIKIRLSNEKKIREYLTLVDKNVITSSTNLAGEITSVSEAFCAISGYAKEELLGNNHSMIKHEDMPKEIYEDLWKTIKQDKTWSGEIKNRAKDGGFYWVKATIYPIFDEERKKIGYTAIRVDISDKKEIDSLLRNSKLNEKKIQDYVYLTDRHVITSSTDLQGNITYVSEAFSKISGYSKEELIGQNHSMIRHSDMSGEVYKGLWKTIALGETWRGEIKNRTKEGGFYWVDATIYPKFDIFGKKIGYTAIRIDVTDKKKLEELIDSNEVTATYNSQLL